MKYITLLFALAITLTSCNSNDDFIDTDTDTIAQSFETRPVNFTAANNYEVVIQTPNSIDQFENDMTLVYLLQNEQPDTWVLLPQVFYAANFEYQYNYSATSTSTTILLDSPVLSDLDFLPNQELLGKIFRIVRIPVADFSSDLDINNYDAVMNAVGLDTQDIMVIE
ncbi:dihydrolipoamide dehydrogenase [uncultured Nonlabens sp.]|uniref:dihydrolipoamide dehydrogenase n=1 Tax=uncultured Nonlabens sp. TaxID=859306 RepID=UPI00261F0FB9|nr:dihydrolipoamide dehydrogenase [uncultured Nonlabens sp.]